MFSLSDKLMTIKHILLLRKPIKILQATHVDISVAFSRADSPYVSLCKQKVDLDQNTKMRTYINFTRGL